MSGPGQADSSLSVLTARLRGGVGEAAAASRPADQDHRDAAALAGPWRDAIRAGLRTIRQIPWTDPDGPANAIGSLTNLLAADRPLLLAALMAPDRILAEVASMCDASPAGTVSSWLGMFWIAEAAWAVLSGTTAAAAGLAAGDRDLLCPLAARLRFLVSSEPMRSRERTDAWWAWQPDLDDFGQSGLLDRALGDRSWYLLAARCQEARSIWLAYLDEFESHAYLAAARPAQVEQELRTVVFRESGGRELLGISGEMLAKPAPLSTQDRSAFAMMAERHFLPRFDLQSVILLAAREGRTKARRRGRIGLAGLAAAAALAAVACAAWLDVRQATWIAVGCYLLIGTGAVVFGPGWAAPWLLRLPAASAVAVIALVSFLPGGWLAAPPGGWYAAGALLFASVGYLMTEARNHGVSGRALVRPLAVALVAGVHALLISLIGLVAVAPAFVANGAGFADLWDKSGYRQAGMVLLLATAWCLAVGVFSQILWDDRPITAPLAHVSWRSGR